MISLFEQCGYSLFQEADCSSYDQIFNSIASRAESLSDPSRDEEERYIQWVMECLSGLNSVPRPVRWQIHPQGRGVKVFRHRLGSVEFCHLWLSPGGIIPYHDHACSNGVMRLLKGSVVATSFDVVKLYPEGMTLQSSVTADLFPGQMMSFCQQRNNVHAVEAGAQGAYILDVFTQLNDDAQCRYLHLEQHSDNGLVKAIWSQEPG